MSFRVRILIAPNNLKRAQSWGDFFFANSLRTGFETCGVPARIVARDHWYDDLQDNEIDLYLRGYGGFTPIENRLSFLWIISHPGNLQTGEVDQYDHIFCASNTHRKALARQSSRRKVTALLQATDPALMKPYEQPEPSNILFVGNNLRGGRASLKQAAAAGLSVDLYGASWKNDPIFGPWLRGERIPNHELGLHYAGANVVLNDHWRDMRLCGYLSNRIFDVLACGRPIVSDRVKGIPEAFSEYIYTWSDQAEFKSAVDQALSEGPEMRAKRRAFAETVRRDHSFESRAKVMISRAKKLLSAEQ